MEQILSELADSLFNSYMDSMRHSPYGVVILDEHGKVFGTNALAKTLLCGDGITLETTEIKASTNREQKALSALISAKINSAPHATNTPSNKPSSSSELLINRPSGKRAYIVICSSLSFPQLPRGRRPAAMLVIHDHEHRQEAPVQRMKYLFGLTTTECLVANAIMHGHSLEQCARELGHSVSTSRNLLKRVFAKTNTKRQNELVSLLLRSPLLINPAPPAAALPA